MADHGDKTEKPTPQRLQKARKEGKFLSSKEFVGGLQFVTFAALLSAFASPWMHEARRTTTWVIKQAFDRDLNGAQFILVGTEALSRLLAPLGAAGAVLIVAMLATQLLMTKGGVSLEKLKPSVKRLNPISKLKELPSRNIPATIQAAAMLAVFGTAIYFVVKGNIETFLMLPMMATTTGVSVVGATLQDLFWKGAGVFAVFGVVDLFRQYRRYQKEMRMSKREIRDEVRQSEGDPQIRARIRRLRRDLLRQQMMREVPKATAVVVNPTHYAVALRYDHGTSAVPMVVAKGRNHLALRIREIAVANQVPLIENPPLAQALYKSVKVGQEIPAHLYRAVAEVLAYIYRLMTERAEASSTSLQKISRIR